MVHLKQVGARTRKSRDNMDLLSNLNDSLWKNASPNQVNGLKQFCIVRSKNLQKGKWEISCRENIEDAVLVNAILEGCTGKSHPLQSVRNADLKIDGNNIVAINLDDDCVVRK